jgi:hypothetical protein
VVVAQAGRSDAVVRELPRERSRYGWVAARNAGIEQALVADAEEQRADLLDRLGTGPGLGRNRPRWSGHRHVRPRNGRIAHLCQRSPQAIRQELTLGANLDDAAGRSPLGREEVRYSSGRGFKLG